MRPHAEGFPKDLLESYPDDCQPLGPLSDLGNAGGSSGARLIRYEASRGPLLVRVWPAGTTAPPLHVVHAWVVLLERWLACVAAPLATRTGTTFVPKRERLCQVEPWKPGAAIESGPSIGQVRAVASTLARLHRVLEPQGRRGRSPGLARRLATLVSLHNGGLDRLARAIEDAPPSEAQGVARTWLSRARSRLDPVLEAHARAEPGDLALQPCLRDCRAAHWLFVADELTGLVDFGAMDVDSPAFDLARLRLDWWPDANAGGELLCAEYGRHAEIAEAGWALLPILEQSTALLTGANWIGWHFLEQRTFEPVGAVVAGIRRSLRWIDSRLPFA